LILHSFHRFDVGGKIFSLLEASFLSMIAKAREKKSAMI
jgi:hypothetical protein